MKNSGIEWIGEIPDSWNVVQLASLFIEHKQKNTGMQSNNLLSLSYGKIKRKDINTSDGLLPESFENYNVVDSGDIVLRLTDLQNDQRSLRTGLCLEKGIVTSAYVTLRKRNANLNSEFMHYYLHSFDVRKGFYGMGSGVRQGLNFDGIKKLAVLLPPQKIQEAIVEYLSKKLGEVDKLIEVQQAQIDKLKEYKQSVITEAVTKGLDPTVPMKDSGVEWIGMIPCEWMVEKLKFHAMVNNEKKFGEQLPYIALENIEGFTGKLIDTENVYDVNEAIVAEKGDVLFGKLRPYLAKVYRVQNKSYVSSEFAVFRCNDVSSNFLKWYMLGYGFLDTVNASTCGTKMPRANIDFISNMPIPVISIEEQEKIAAHIDTQCAKIDKLIAIKQAKIDKLQEYKKSLIYEYVTGKKEVVEC